MTTVIRERIEKLLALALNNPNEHEAAAAALAACRLIHEHKALAAAAPTVVSPYLPPQPNSDFTTDEQALRDAQAKYAQYASNWSWNRR